MAGSLGVFIAADLLTFYLVYALVSVPAYYLVAHDEEPDLAPRRRRLYGVCAPRRGGAADRLRHAGGGRAERQRRKFAMSSPRCLTSPWRDAALALIIIGFGMKIALVPLHGWMPLTYTAAPIPAAAVLSGAAVKAGVIGLIRFLPLGAAFPGWGEALVWVGFISAFYWRRDRRDPARPEDHARLFEHQPDGRDRRGARHGASPAPTRARRRTSRSMRRTMCW